MASPTKHTSEGESAPQTGEQGEGLPINKNIHPLITVVTVTYNAADTIERTLLSVEEQTYPRIEHLIIDGCSTDATLQHVQRYVERGNPAKGHVIRIVREPDKGLYDAMNKGITQSEGAYILFLNAGDKFHEATTIAQVVEKMDYERHSVNPAVVYGETDLVDNEGRFVRHRRLRAPERLTAMSFMSGMLVCHQSFYVRADIAKLFPYDLNYRYSADYDWCIRIMKFAQRRGLKFVNTGLILTDYLNEGMTTRNHRRSLLERLRLMAHHYGWPAAIGQHLWFVVRAVVKK